MVDITNSTVLKFNSNVIKRFEHNLKDGTMILCNMENVEFWFGNKESREFIDLIDGKNTVQDIYNEVLSQYDETDYETVINAYNSIITDLFEKNFIETVNND